MGYDKNMGMLEYIAFILVLIGALTWGTVALFNFNVVLTAANIFGFPMIATILYILVGVSAVWLLFKVVRKMIKG